MVLSCFVTRSSLFGSLLYGDLFDIFGSLLEGDSFHVFGSLEKLDSLIIVGSLYYRWLIQALWLLSVTLIRSASLVPSSRVDSFDVFGSLAHADSFRFFGSLVSNWLVRHLLFGDVLDRPHDGLFEAGLSKTQLPAGAKPLDLFV